MASARLPQDALAAGGASPGLFGAFAGANERVAPSRGPSDAELAHEAAFGLDETQPMFCARRVVTTPQRWFLLALAAVIIFGTLAAPQTTGAVAFAALAALYSANIVLRVVLHVAGWRGRGVHRPNAVALADISDNELPTYTVLVPLFGEAHMVRGIVHALSRLDYPRDKLDIKLVFEECDPETVAAARALSLDERFQILVVPDGQPRTKPRACNFALNFAHGEFVVIFDAEDRPDPNQLKKAVLAFRAAPRIACFQARLAYYNGEQNWLARGIMALTPQAAVA